MPTENSLSAEDAYSEIDRGALADRIYKVLKRELLSCRLVPGQRLALDEFAKRFRVSVTPVRDALRLLAADGLVELVPRRGAFVTQPRWYDLREIYQLREILECAAVESVVAKGAPALRDLHKLLEQMAATNLGESHSDYLSYIELDQRFHQYIVDCLENRRMSEVYGALGSHTLVARALFSASDQRASRTLAEHQFILTALQQGNAHQARTAIQAHLQAGLAEMLRQIPEQSTSDTIRRDPRIGP